MTHNTRQTPTWRDEFPDDYNVPAVIATHPDLDDVSWHNDVCPSFTLKGYDGGNNRLDVRLWVAHPDKAAREFPDMPRLYVSDGERAVFFESEDDADAPKAIEAVLIACTRLYLESLDDAELRAYIRRPRAFNPRINEAAILLAELERRRMTTEAL